MYESDERSALLCIEIMFQSVDSVLSSAPPTCIIAAGRLGEDPDLRALHRKVETRSNSGPSKVVLPTETGLRHCLSSSYRFNF